MSIDQDIQRAAQLLQDADALLITAGAGMGVDSGLPDFRGPEGFWGAYPALGKVRLHFEDIACPQVFLDHPKLAWGFYGHRLNLYRACIPHDGFQLLKQWAEELPYGAFVFTSNVDGQFLKAGFAAQRICEVHGSINYLQCLNRCTGDIWHAGKFQPAIDEANCMITGEIPHCPNCGGIARPNILMFGDADWLSHRQSVQMEALRDWLSKTRNLVVIEIGAGTSIPTVRNAGEGTNCPLIRINRQECQVRHPADVGIPLGGLEALRLVAGVIAG